MSPEYSLAEIAPIDTAPLLSYRLIAEYPHDIRRFTQGLEIEDNAIFESTGGYGDSHIYINDLRGGRLRASRTLPASVFGEGLTYLAGRLFVLTWREGLAIVLDRQLVETQRFSLPGEGWGLTHMTTSEGPRLVMSDGSSTLKIVDPRSFRLSGSLDVRDGTQAVSRLNELEFARGTIFANVWLTSRVAVISPQSGAVTGWIDLLPLEQRLYASGATRNPDNVLNGIAYDPNSGHFFVTGKRWPKMFEIEIDGQGPGFKPKAN